MVDFKRFFTILFVLSVNMTAIDLFLRQKFVGKFPINTFDRFLKIVEMVLKNWKKLKKRENKTKKNYISGMQPFEIIDRIRV